jgi:hypothetical protein
MPLVGFEPAIPVSERPQTHALDCKVADNLNLYPSEIAQL